MRGGSAGSPTARSTRPLPSGALSSPTAVTTGNTIEVYAGSGRVVSQAQESGAAPAQLPCSYGLAYGALDAGGFATPYRSMATREFVDGPGPGVEMWVVERCPPGEGYGTYRWVPSPQAVDINALIGAAYERVRAQVPAPSLNISPRPEVGVPAQLGIWLAVDDPGQLNVVAQVGPVWAAATARLTGMTWAMGNGDVVECVGLGTPYPEGSGTYDQGPCGYTYTQVGDAGMRQVTATANWSVQLTTSTGRNEMLDPVTASTTFDYEVYEIVTVVEG